MLTFGASALLVATFARSSAPEPRPPPLPYVGIYRSSLRMQPPSRPLATRRAALGIAGGELVQRLAVLAHAGSARRYLATPTVDCAAITNRAVARLAFANLGPLPHVGLNRGGVWVFGTAEVIGSGRRQD